MKNNVGVANASADKLGKPKESMGVILTMVGIRWAAN